MTDPRPAVAALERVIEAWNREDVEGVLQDMAPDCVFRSAMGRMLEGVGAETRGHEEWRRWREEVFESFERFQMEMEQVLAIGDAGFATLRMQMLSRGGGVPLEQAVAWTWRLGPDGITELNTHFDFAEGLRNFATWL